MSALDGAAVVATLDRPRELALCLASLAAARPSYREIVVVDQSAAEDQRQLALVHGARYLHLERRGLSRARNAGLATVSAEWVHFPDDDCTIAPDLLAAVARGLARHPGAGFACAHIEVPGGRAIMAGMDGRERAIARSADVLRTTMSPGLFVRRRLLERLGGFDERFGVGGRFGSGEESDLLFRALAQGETGLYLPEARVYHPDQLALRDPEAQRRRAYAYGRGWGALFAKHSAPDGAAGLHRRYLARALGGATFAALAGRAAEARRYWATFLGRRDGWREWRAMDQESRPAGSRAHGVAAGTRERLHPVVSSSGALIVVRAANLAVRLLILFVIARQVPPPAFGLVIYALAIAEIGKVLADFGMDTLAIREYAVERDPAENARFAATLLASKLVLGSLVTLGLAAFFVSAQPGDQAALGLIAGLTVLTASLANFSLDFFQARLRMRQVVLPVLLTSTAGAIAALLLLPRLSDLRAQVALFPAVETATALMLFLWVRREGLLRGAALAWGRVPGLVRRSLPVAVTAIFIMVYSRMDVLVLSRLLDPAAVGHYGIAFRLTEPFQIAAAAFGLSVFSRFSTLFQGDEGSLTRSAVRYLSATLGYGAAAAIAVGVLAPPLIERLFPAYLPAVPILRVLAAALVFRTLNATLAGILLGAGRFRLITLLAGWNLLFFFVLLSWLVPRFGALGAALALLIGEGVNTALQLGLVARAVSHRGSRSAVAERRVGRER